MALWDLGTRCRRTRSRIRRGHLIKMDSIQLSHRSEGHGIECDLHPRYVLAPHRCWPRSARRRCVSPRWRRAASTGRAATTRASWCRPAIRRCARRAASAKGAAAPGRSPIRDAGGGTSAMCWLKSEVKPRGREPVLRVGRQGRRPGREARAVRWKCRSTAIGGDYRHFDLPSDPTGEVLQEGLRGREALPRLDLRAARLSRSGGSRCYLKDKITRPRRKPCCMSGVVR